MQTQWLYIWILFVLSHSNIVTGQSMEEWKQHFPSNQENHLNEVSIYQSAQKSETSFFLVGEENKKGTVWLYQTENDSKNKCPIILQSDQTSRFVSIWVKNSQEIFLAGHTVEKNVYYGLIWHCQYIAEKWEVVKKTRLREPLNDIKGNKEKILAVGLNGYFVQASPLDTENWKQVLPAPEFHLNSIWGNSQNWFVVGDQGTILHCNCTEGVWRQLQNYHQENLFDIDGRDSNKEKEEIIIAGQNSILRYIKQKREWKKIYPSSELIKKDQSFISVYSHKKGFFLLGEEVVSFQEPDFWQKINLPKDLSGSLLTIWHQGNRLFVAGTNGLMYSRLFDLKNK